jgi:hypothetical protein
MLHSHGYTALKARQIRSMRAVLCLAIGSALALVGSSVSAQAAADTLRLAERVEAINAVLSPNLGVLPAPINIEPCSIFLTLSRDREPMQQLRPEIQSQLTDLIPAACKEPRDIAYKTPAWIIRSIHREGNNRLRVVAQVIPRAAYTYNVEYQLIPAVRRDGTASWSVNEVRLYDFVSYVFH